MSNHVHLAIQVGDIPLSRVMQNISTRYTRYFNRKTEVTGHLFQGSYKAILLDVDSYLLELVRYIHLNPVRAGMINLPEEHPWSSHNVYCGTEKLPWVTTEWIQTQFSQKSDDAIRLYKDFVADGFAEGHRREFHKGSLEGRLLGDDDFAESALRKSDQEFKRRVSLDDILTYVCKYYAIQPAELAQSGKQRKISEARTMAAWLIRENECLSLTELGRRTKRDISSLSQGINRLLKRAAQDNALAERMGRIRSDLAEYP
jgi:hypothetical protein